MENVTCSGAGGSSASRYLDMSNPVDNPRATPCTSTYTLRVFCCAPNNVLLREPCNHPGEFEGRSYLEAVSAAGGAGWLLRGPGVRITAAWCPAHARRTPAQQELDIRERGPVPGKPVPTHKRCPRCNQRLFLVGGKIERHMLPPSPRGGAPEECR